MSSQSDYNFDKPASSSTSSSSSFTDSISLHLPFALLSAAIAIIFVQQTINSFKLKSSLNDSKDQIGKAIVAQSEGVKAGTEVEKKLSDIVQDLMLLAQTDEKAKAIVAKYGIQLGPNSGAKPAEPAK